MIQCFLRACYCWVHSCQAGASKCKLAGILNHKLFVGAVAKKAWFRFGFLAKHNSRNSFNASCSIQTLRHLGPECTQESHVTGLHSTDHRFPPRAFPGVFTLWGGGRFAAHTGHLSPRRGDRIWGGSRKGREGEECSGNFHFIEVELWLFFVFNMFQPVVFNASPHESPPDLLVH